MYKLNPEENNHNNNDKIGVSLIQKVIYFKFFISHCSICVKNFM